ARGMTFPHRVDVLVGARRRADRGLEIERDQAGLDPGVGELLHHLGLGLGHPGALPVLGQRLDVGALAVDPGLGSRVAVQIDDAHVSQWLAASFAATSSPRAFFDTLPKVETGKSGSTSSRSGSLNRAISLAARNAVSSGRVRCALPRRITQAHIFSPRVASGIGTQATFCTAGCIRIRFSTSSALLLSPPRLSRSFLRAPSL